MATIGDVVTRLTVDKRQFETGLASAAKDANTHFGRIVVDAQRVNKALGSGMTSSSNRATYALLELSRGVEDAASQFGTQGLAGALRGSMNNMAALATMLNPMAGVVVGLGAALTTVLIPALMETRSEAELAAEAADKLKTAIEEAHKAARAGGVRVFARGSAEEELASARGTREFQTESRRFAARLTGSTADRRALVGDISGTLGDRRNQLSEISFALERATGQLHDTLQRSDGSWSFTDRLKELREIVTDLTHKKQEMELGVRFSKTDLRIARMQLQDGLLSDWLRTDGNRSTPEQDFNQRRKLDDLYFRPEREEAAMRQSAVANFEQFAMQRSLLAGLGGRLSGLQQQRQSMAMGGQAFRNPEATTRGNAVDRIIEIAQAKREAKDDVWRKEQLTKLDKQIELTEKLIEEVKNGDNGGLKPAGVG